MNPAAPHILFVNEFYYPDICASSAVLTDRLPRLAAARPDWKITVLAGRRAWDDPTVLHAAEETHRGVRIVRVDRPALPKRSILQRALGFFAFQRNALRAARGLGKIDLVVGTTAPPQGAGIAARIAKRAGCPFVYTVLDLYPDLADTLDKLRSSSLIYRRWLKKDTQLMQRAAAVVSISTPMSERIARTRPVPAEKCITIHDGFDETAVAPPASGATNRFAQHYNPQGRFVVQYAGNMGLSHPFEAIMAATRQLEGERDVLFQFIGDGPQRGFIEQHATAQTQVLDYQPAERLWEVLHAADACLISQHPRMYDQALPFKVYGIFAARKPVIFVGNPASEIAGWLAEANAGITVRHEAPEQLTAAIRRLQSDRAEAEAMGQRGYALFKQRLQSSAAAEKWLALFERVLGGD